MTITNKQVEDAKNIINQIKAELEKIRETHNEEADEIAEALLDMEAKIEKKERIPKLTFKSFLETSSNLSSIGSLAVSLGQIIGMLPIPK